MYGYYWGHTAAQIELLAVDQPIIIYDHSKDKTKKGKHEFKKANPLDVLKAANEWREKYEGREHNEIRLDLSGFNMNNSNN